MTRRVVSSHATDDDLTGAVEVYRPTADAATAERFFDAIEQCVRRSAAFPSVGSMSAEALTGIPGLRSLAVERFPYTNDDDVVRVHRVLHARRDVGRAFADWGAGQPARNSSASTPMRTSSWNRPPWNATARLAPSRTNPAFS